jgi:hypothetical protein
MHDIYSRVAIILAAIALVASAYFFFSGKAEVQQANDKSKVMEMALKTSTEQFDIERRKFQEALQKVTSERDMLYQRQQSVETRLRLESNQIEIAQQQQQRQQQRIQCEERNAKLVRDLANHKSMGEYAAARMALKNQQPCY